MLLISNLPFLFFNMELMIGSSRHFALLSFMVCMTTILQHAKGEPQPLNPHVEDGHHREGKLFSMFNIVQFKNDPCNTATTTSGGRGRRGGTCYTANECATRGGQASGTCASGFGVCCLFVRSASSSNIRENCTYIENPGSPSPYADSTAVTYTINKCSSDVCFVRLDFETFSLLGTGNTVDATTGTDNTSPDDDVPFECQDQFDVTVTSGQTIPTICGENSGEHMFLELGNGPLDSATLSFSFADSSNKAWDIKVTQYKCGSQNAPPSGCLQYHTGLTGRLKTFNYDLANDNHLPDQMYSICVRQENGYCCVQYSVCPEEAVGDNDGFSLSPTGNAMQDSNCASSDFIAIPDSSSICAQTPIGQLNGRYCGSFLNSLIDGTVNVPICDCTPPFSVDVFTNDAADLLDADPTVASKGICLDYTQIPCTG